VRAYLLPISDREPLRWIVTEERTAVPSRRAREAASLAAGDLLYLYTTRGCFRNPTRDRGRIIGLAAVTGPSRLLPEPVRFGQREFSICIPLSIERLAAQGGGVELAPLIGTLATFPDPSSWSALLRRALVPLNVSDLGLLNRALIPVAPPYPETVSTYAAGAATRAG
jgi:hypothetical protein